MMRAEVRAPAAYILAASDTLTDILPPVDTKPQLMSQVLKSLEQQFHRITQIEHALTFLGWDQMVMMPNAGSQPRSSAMAELSSMRHELLASDAMGDSLAEVVVCHGEG